MTNLRRRLAKLEARVTDQQGLVPNTPHWIAHWTGAMDRILSGEYGGPTERIPLAFVDHILAEAARPDHVHAMA